MTDKPVWIKLSKLFYQCPVCGNVMLLAGVEDFHYCDECGTKCFMESKEKEEP